MIIRGYMVSFVTPNEKIITPPNDFVLVHDPSGKNLRKCDFYILAYHTEHQKVHVLDHDLEAEATDYYGQGHDLENGTIDIPKGPWQRAGVVNKIRYRRLGDLGEGYQSIPDYEHPYETPVPLFRAGSASQPRGWRLTLPTGCVVDGRGFVSP